MLQNPLFRWVDIRLETVGQATVFLATLLPLVAGSNAATLGLSVSSSVLFVSTVNNLFRAFSNVEADILAAERFRDTMDIPQVVENYFTFNTFFIHIRLLNR